MNANALIINADGKFGRSGGGLVSRARGSRADAAAGPQMRHATARTSALMVA